MDKYKKNIKDLVAKNAYILVLEIDFMVYELYWLSEEEIEIVQKS